MESKHPKEELIYWINERERIRLHKEEYKASKPWSTDPIMQSVYFCNIHREDDRVTKWIREKWETADCTGDMEHTEANMCMARLVNRIDSLQQLLWPWDTFDSKWFKEVAYSMSKDRMPFWGNAYVVTTHGQPMSKLEYACGVLEQCFKQLPYHGLAPTLEAHHAALMRLEGFGSFMAAQVVADLKNTPGHELYNAPDWWTWSAHGPGSLRGLTWFHGYKITPGIYHDCIVQAWEEVKPSVPTMCMQDFQNCLCEYDKFMRVKRGVGRSKRGYPGV